MAGKRFTVEAVFKAVDKVSAPVSRMQNRVGKMTRSMGRNFDRLNRKMDKFGQRARQGALVVAAAAAVTTAAIVDIVRTGAEFEQQLITAGAKFPGIVRRGTESYQALEDAARKAGRETEFTAASAAGALNFMATAGLNVEVAIAALPGAIDLATVANVDLARSTDIATDTMGAFGLESDNAATAAKNLARVNDVLAKTSITSNTTLETLFETISQAGPVVAGAGGSIETMAALAGVLGSAAIKGSKAGTTIKNAYAALADPRKIALLNRLGVRTKDAAGNTRDMLEVLDDLFKVLKTQGGQTQQQAMFAIFGLRSIAGVNKLLNVGADSLKEYRTELENAGGTATELANVIRDSITNEFKELNSAVESVKISTFLKIRDSLSGVIEKVTEWVRANEDLISSTIAEKLNEILTNFDNIVAKAKLIAKVTVAVFALITVLKTLVFVIGAVNLIMSLNPIGLIIIGIVALVAAITFLIIKFDLLRKATLAWQLVVISFKQVWQGVADWFTGLWDGIVNTFFAAIDKIKRGIDLVKTGGGVLAKAFGFGGDDEETDQARDIVAGAFGIGGPQVVSPGERVANSLQERNTTTTGEVTIRDETGRAELTAGELGAGLRLIPTGGF